MLGGMVAPVLTIDGPAGSGKGTISALAAEKLGWHLLDSGALYRLVALAALRHAVSLDHEQALARIAVNLDARFALHPVKGLSVWLNGLPVDEALREERTGEAASKVATWPLVRDALLQRQRAFCQVPGLVADGRDMGTVVFPQAHYKIFLTASQEERANRRYKQLKEKGLDANLQTLLEDLQARDARDANRAVAPLKPADDALVIDSTGKGIDEVLAQVLDYVAQGVHPS
ncbi:(d)CMP kinase [Thiorhodospira sibirica]|uniref:(d)CMP kinase n=1 Tax=Thiorhodospira sibirica TaxID=154347 RepID=UPI00022C5E5E|nr:(d)CMP kinase [Thiorhodospira sibirica]